MQLRGNIALNVADVVVVCLAAPSPELDAAAAFCAANRIRFLRVPREELGGAAMHCARFLLARVLDPAYAEILYLDGDTQIAGALDPLMRFSLKAGQILAAPDPMSVMIDNPKDPWPARRAYFRSIGLADHQHTHYFNTGVLRFRRADWDAISRDALKLCTDAKSLLKFADQDALNLIVGANHRPISFRWNFPLFFMNFGAEAAINPRVYHFMSNPRPWQGAFAPWGEAWHAPYRAFLQNHPELGLTLQPLPKARFLKYFAQQRYKRFVESRTWGTSAVRARIADMEANAVV